MTTLRNILKQFVPAQGDYTITLSENEPAQSSSPYGGWTSGEQATIFRAEDGGWAYCIHGIGDTGLYGEADDVVGFKSAKAAEAAAREDYAEGEAFFDQQAEWDAALSELDISWEPPG